MSVGGENENGRYALGTSGGLCQLKKVIFYLDTALNQLAGTGWLKGDELKNFISRLQMSEGYFIFVGLEVFPSPGSARRQVIHSLDFFVLLYQDKRTNIS